MGTWARAVGQSWERKRQNMRQEREKTELLDGKGIIEKEHERCDWGQ